MEKEEEGEGRDDTDELMTGNDGVIGRLDSFVFFVSWINDEGLEEFG